MLDPNDIKQIGEILDERLKGTEKRMDERFEGVEKRMDHLAGAEGRIIEAVGEMLEQNVLPVIDKLGERLDKVEGKIDVMEGGLTDLRKTVANLPDKDYLDRKFADFDGKIVVREKKQDQKVNLLIDALDEQHVLRPNTIKTIKAIQVFPPPPQVA